MMEQMQQMMGGGGMGGLGGFGGMGGGQTAPAQDDKPPKEKYAEQLAQIKEMGFNDEEVIL